MQGGYDICRVVSEKGKAVEWRPHAHHVLHLRDGHFDSRFNAFLRCEMHLTNLYKNVIHFHHENLLDRLLSDMKQSISKAHEASYMHKRKTHLTCITSALSNPDLEILLEFVMSSLDQRSDYVVLGSACHNVDSALDILSEIAGNLKMATDERTRSEKRAASANVAMSSKLKSGSIRTIHEMPSQAILDLLSSCEALNGKKGLVLLLQNAERIDNVVFSEFIEMVHRIDGVHMHLITISSAICPLPLRLNKSAQCMVSVYVASTSTNWEIYDDFMGQVVSMREMPVSLTSNVWSWIHDTFWRSNCCVRSALDMILRTLLQHFSRRCSLLCMFEETQWLLEMKLVKKGGKTNEERVCAAISEIIGYMDQDDIRGTGLALARAGCANRSIEVSLAKRKLAANLARARIDKSWFKCLRDVRDKYHFYHGETGARLDRSEFCCDILWAAVTSSNSSVFAHVDDLIEAFVKMLSKIPLRAIYNLIGSFMDNLQPGTDLKLHLNTVYDTGSQDEINLELASSDAPLKSNEWRNSKEVICAQCAAIETELEDNFFIFAEMLETMHSLDVHPNACLTELPRNEGSAKRKTITTTLLPTEGMRVMSSSETSKSALFNSPMRSKEYPDGSPDVSTSSIAAFGKHVHATPDSFTIGSPVRAGNMSPLKATTPLSTSKSRLATLYSPAGFTSGSMFTLTEIAIEDFSSWLRSAASFFRTIPRPDAIPGVLDMERGAEVDTFAAADGNTRYIYLKSLSRSKVSSDHSIISNENVIPDISILSQIVFQSVSTRNVFDWFDMFKNECSMWAPVIDPSAAKKRKREKEGISEDSLLKSRFVKALSDLEKFGLIKIKGGGLEVTRIAYMWMTE